MSDTKREEGLSRLTPERRAEIVAHEKQLREQEFIPLADELRDLLVALEAVEAERDTLLDDLEATRCETQRVIDVFKEEQRNLEEVVKKLVGALEDCMLGHRHDANDEHMRPMGDSYGWCSFCGEKVNFGPGVAEAVLSETAEARKELGL